VDYRSGRTQIKTVKELATELAIPVYYIIIGQAQAAFPNTSTPAPSSFVQVMLTGQQVDPFHRTAFPVYVNWKQWNSVIVPILQPVLNGDALPDFFTNSPLWPSLLGHLGGAVGVGNIPTQVLGPGVYTCNRGLRAEYVQLLQAEITARAIAAGYPNP